MNQKEYSEIKKHVLLEHEQAGEEKHIDSFRRVKEGKKFSLNDLQIVHKFLSEQPAVKSRDQIHNMNDAIGLLEHRTSMTRENISSSKKRLRKRGLDLDRLRRQRRLQQDKERKDKEKVLGH